MAIPAITSPNPGYEQIAAGASYSRTITASNSPTSFAVTGIPAGLSLNTSTGEITGSPTATVPTAVEISVTATNGDGTSAAQTWLIVVLPSVTGTTQGEWVIPVDLLIREKKLALPGIGSPQPASEPPRAGEVEEVLGTWVEGEAFDLALGLITSGVLQELDPDRIRVLWREIGTESTIELQVDDLDVTGTGAGATKRYKVPVFVDPDLVSGSLDEKRNGSRKTGYLQIIAESANDDRDFSTESAQESLGTFLESSSVNDTFALTIDTESADAREYDVTINAVFPTDTALNCQVVRRVSLTYSGGTYVLGTTSGSTSDTGSSTVEANWDSTLTNTSLTATTTGLSVGTTVAASAQKQPGYEIVLPLVEFTIDSDPKLVTGGSGIESYQFLAEDGTTSLYEWTLSDGDAAGDVSSDIMTGISEAQADVYFDDATDTVTIRFGAGTAVFSAKNVQTTDVTNRGPNTLSAGPSYSDAYVKVSVTGVEMPGNSLKFANNPARFQLVGSFDS